MVVRSSRCARAERRARGRREGSEREFEFLSAGLEKRLIPLTLVKPGPRRRGSSSAPGRMNIVLFEDDGYRNLLPLTWLRACFELRCGCDLLIDKIRACWGPHLVAFALRDELQAVMAERVALVDPDPQSDWLLVNACTLVTGDVAPPPADAAWMCEGRLVAASVDEASARGITHADFRDAARLRSRLPRLREETVPAGVTLIGYPWELVAANVSELERQCGTGGVQDGRLYAGAHVVNAGAVHVGRGASIKPGVVLDAELGPIHVEAGVRIEPNAVVQGPCYVGRECIVRPGAVLRGGVSLGPLCRVGGELEGSIMQGFANKQHDGFLGHSYVGAWTNLGADTITSDLKNTYGTVRVSLNGVPVETGRHFVGSFIGEHAKTGIGTILPTGCVVGCAANVFTAGAVPKFVPSFAWLTDEGMVRYRTDKTVEIARVVMGRRGVDLTQGEQALLVWSAGQAPRVEAAGWKGS
jgi:UDP-N-acetylglucosamine diphosphorylase/glucosamine-1-phosphate N-acetyltransferase